jgi:hypothetical protein
MKMAPVLVFGAGTNWAGFGEELRWLGNNGRDRRALRRAWFQNARVQRDPAELGADGVLLAARAPLPKQQQLRVQLLPGAS